MSNSSALRVLVIDDDRSIRATLVDILELNGHTVLQAGDGIEGLEMAVHKRPEIIISDIAMPGRNGFELIRALKAEDVTRAIPVIFITASVEPERMREAMDLGAEDFIYKPFTEDQVLGSIRARMEKKALLDELDAFAHTVAHDLKNPIAVLMGRSELLHMSWETADDVMLLKQVIEIEKNARRLNNIVDELLILAGVRRQTVRLQPIEMAPVVEEALARLEDMVRKSGAGIERPPAWPVAQGHAPWVAEIWTNYLSNALKYGGTPPQVRLGAEAVAEGAVVRFWVQDNGAGLTEEQQSKLFLQFSRVTETRVQGHGLGLSIVRRIAEKLGGRAGVESKLGVGSRFWFELPVESHPPGR